MKFVAQVLWASIGLAACGGANEENGSSASPDSAPICVSPHGDVSLDPYYRSCDRSDPASCPPPYACTTETSTHDPAGPLDVCLIPCSCAGECSALGVGYFCMGVEADADVGADDHCIDV